MNAAAIYSLALRTIAQSHPMEYGRIMFDRVVLNRHDGPISSFVALARVCEVSAATGIAHSKAAPVPALDLFVEEIANRALRLLEEIERDGEIEGSGA